MSDLRSGSQSRVVTYITEISLHVTLSNQSHSHSHSITSNYDLLRTSVIPPQDLVRCCKPVLPYKIKYHKTAVLTYSRPPIRLTSAQTRLVSS